MLFTKLGKYEMSGLSDLPLEYLKIIISHNIVSTVPLEAFSMSRVITRDMLRHRLNKE